MKILIHAVPERMWYVRDFLIPQLTGQGIDREDIAVWLDDEGKGNLQSCMESFAALEDVPGGTWHLQDDVLVASDFAVRAQLEDVGVVYGFCCRYFRDDPAQAGTVYAPDAWHSFQCVRIPNETAAACAEWFFSGQYLEAPEVLPVVRAGKGDDTVFHTFLELHRGRFPVRNLAPNLVEHVDWLIGGSVLHAWRDYFARSDAWAEPEAVEALREALRARTQNQ